MTKFNVKEVFDRYSYNAKLEEADIFHLYDTGEECAKDNSGYKDSRFFELVIFNTITMEKRNCGRHDGITSLSFLNPAKLVMGRVFADGSFLIRLQRPVKIDLLQNVFLYG